MSTLDSKQKALRLVHFALEKKAYDLVLLAVGPYSALSEYFLICTGRSDTQVQAISQGIEINLKPEGIRPLSIEGYSHGQWVVMDYDDVIVQIFYEPVRSFYDLERLWSKAEKVDLPEPYQTQVRDLRLATDAY